MFAGICDMHVDMCSRKYDFGVACDVCNWHYHEVTILNRPLLDKKCETHHKAHCVISVA